MPPIGAVPSKPAHCSLTPVGIRSENTFESLVTRTWFQPEQRSSVSVAAAMSATLKYECQPLQNGSGAPSAISFLAVVVKAAPLAPRE